LIASASSSDAPKIESKSVLVLNLSQSYPEQSKDDPFNALMNKSDNEIPSLYDLVRMIKYAKTDTLVKGIYIQGSDNSNGFGASEEIRKALADFKTSKKFIWSYAETMSQKAYYVTSVSDFVAVHPQGGLEFFGMSSNLFFLKGIQPFLDIGTFVSSLVLHHISWMIQGHDSLKKMFGLVDLAQKVEIFASAETIADIPTACNITLQFQIPSD